MTDAATLVHRAAPLPDAWADPVLARLRAAVGDAPVLLLGSRAIGTAVASSDCDVAVLVTTWRAVRLASRLARAGDELTRDLGVRISVHPVRRAPLRHPRARLYAHKIRREAVVLSGHRLGALLGDDVPVVANDLATASYLLSAVRGVLLACEGPCPSPSARLAHEVRKAALHVGQLRLIARRSYASTLDETLALLGHDDLCRLAERAAHPDAIDRVRDLLVRELDAHPLRIAGWRIPVRNLQYAAVAASRGRPTWRAAAATRSAEVHLAGELVALLASTGSRPSDDVPVDEWIARRDATVSSWDDAHLLGGFGW